MITDSSSNDLYVRKWFFNDDTIKVVCNAINDAIFSAETFTIILLIFYQFTV